MLVRHVANRPGRARARDSVIASGVGFELAQHARQHRGRAHAVEAVAVIADDDRARQARCPARAALGVRAPMPSTTAVRLSTKRSSEK